MPELEDPDGRKQANEPMKSVNPKTGKVKMFAIVLGGCRMPSARKECLSKNNRPLIYGKIWQEEVLTPLLVCNLKNQYRDIIPEIIQFVEVNQPILSEWVLTSG